MPQQQQQQPQQQQHPPLSLLLTTTFAITAWAWSLQGGVDAPVMDCDEVFNYVEPLAFALTGSGLQTWEYAPEFALRSWTYVEAHAWPLRLVDRLAILDLFHVGDNGKGGGITAFNARFPSNVVQRIAIVSLLRLLLHSISLLGEAKLATALGKKFNSPSTTWFAALLMALAPGMSHARRAILPSSACMICFTYALAEWLTSNHVAALLWGSLAVLLCWPFAALVFVPIGVDALLVRGFLPVLLTGLASLLVFGLVPASIDSSYYGRWVWPFLQMVLYNAFGASGGGAHLYGVEPWTFYPKNVFLNLSFLPLVFLGSAALPPSPSRARAEPGKTQTQNTRLDVVKFLLAPVLLHVLLFQSMPHKEERFLFVIYPAVCAGAGLFLATRVPRVVSYAAVLALAVFALSRNLALGRLSAPSTVLR